MSNYENLIRSSEHLDYVSLEGVPGIKIRNSEGVINQDMMLTVLPIKSPNVMIKHPHKHEFDQILTFWGSNPDNMLDLGGEVELTICEPGKEAEKLVFTKAACITIPKGVLHGPLNFKKVNDPQRPIWFQDIVKATEYIRADIK